MTGRITTLHLIAELDANCAVMAAYYCGECLPCLASAEIRRLREAGDALAQGIRTGRWDDALDAWTEVRGD